jgi:hypothetical protein
MPYCKPLTLCAALAAALLGACGSHSPRGVADVPQCRHAANAVQGTEFDTREQLLTLRADAYSECMQAHGYVLDEEELERRMIHKEQVKNSDMLHGDPYYILKRYRQELRLDPDLWRVAAR